MVTASDSATNQSESIQSIGFSSSTNTQSRYNVLVNKVLASLVEDLAKDIDAKLHKQAFQAKVVTVDSRGVVLNCGSDLGLQAGDTFGVRAKRELLTDPDTGLPLEAPGAPIGKIRVAEVYEHTAFAQVVERTGPIKRGDLLEWVGYFEVK